MKKAFSIKAQKPWSKMTMAERTTAIVVLDAQFKKIANAMSLDITQELMRVGMPFHLEANFQLVLDDASQVELPIGGTHK